MADKQSRGQIIKIAIASSWPHAGFDLTNVLFVEIDSPGTVHCSQKKEVL
jgi:hypothetical protein